MGGVSQIASENWCGSYNLVDCAGLVLVKSLQIVAKGTVFSRSCYVTHWCGVGFTVFFPLSDSDPRYGAASSSGWPSEPSISTSAGKHSL